MNPAPSLGLNRTDDRVSISMPTYDHPHSIRETAKVTKGQHIELIGSVTHVDLDEGKVTVDLGVPVTVKADTLRLVTAYVPPKRKAPLVDKAT